MFYLYTQQPNWFYFVYFGYVPKDNEFDCIHINIMNNPQLLDKYGLGT